MPIIQQRALESICNNLPRIAESLEGIANSLASMSAVMLGDGDLAKIIRDIKKGE